MNGGAEAAKAPKEIWENLEVVEELVFLERAERQVAVVHQVQAVRRGLLQAKEK